MSLVAAQYQRSLIEARDQRDILDLALHDAAHTLRQGPLDQAQANALAAMLEGASTAAGGPFTELALATDQPRKECGEAAGSTRASSPSSEAT